MSVLSEKLKYFIDQKGLSIADLARSSGIERSTLYQYIKDRRPLQNRVQLESIMADLHLTPDERTDVLEAYEITRIGMKNYNRRRKVREILESLLTLEEGKTETVKTVQEKIPAEVENQGLIRGELEVNRIVHQVIYETAERGGELKLLVQPDYDLMMESLMLVKGGLENTKVTQLICLEPDSGQDGCSNLEIIRRILRYSVGICHYEPRYYYGKPREHYGTMNVMPYLAVTEKYGIQISSDRKTAILHNDPRTVGYLNEFFDKMCQQSHPLVSSMDSFGGEQAKWGLVYLNRTDFSNTIGMCAGLCCVQFWDEYLIRKYMNPHIPDRERIIKDYTAYTAGLYQKKKQGQAVELMNCSFVEEFIKTGVFREYPAVFFAEPVSREDRREPVDRVLKAVDEGWYHIRMVPAEEFPLSYHWEILAHRGSSMLFQYVYKNQFQVFWFEERDILEATYDFLQSFADGENVLDESQSAELLRKWEKKYLT